MNPELDYPSKFSPGTVAVIHTTSDHWIDPLIRKLTTRGMICSDYAHFVWIQMQDERVKARKKLVELLVANGGVF